MKKKREIQIYLEKINKAPVNSETRAIKETLEWILKDGKSNIN